MFSNTVFYNKKSIYFEIKTGLAVRREIQEYTVSILTQCQVQAAGHNSVCISPT